MYNEEKYCCSGLDIKTSGMFDIPKTGTGTKVEK